MAIKASVRFRLDPKEVKALRGDPEIVEYVRRAAEGLADDVRARTPRRTGAGADSIGVHPAPRSVGASDAGWDKDHFYLGFPESGTKYQVAQGFAWLALENYVYG